MIIFYISESIENLNKKLDSAIGLLFELKADVTIIKNFLGSLKLDVDEMKQSINEVSQKPDNSSEIEKLKVDLPLQTLADLEELETLLHTNKEQKSSFVSNVF